MNQHLSVPGQGGDLAFFIQYFLPMILALDVQRQQQIGTVNGSEIKAKKYEALIIQIWEQLPNFCQFNSPQLSAAFSTIIQYLEKMIN